MTFWLTGDEEHEDKRFDVKPGGIVTGLGFYVAAGSMCMSKIRYRRFWDLPDEWLIGDEWVKGQNSGSRIAHQLARNDVLLRVPGERGYPFKWIRPENTVSAVLRRRLRDRDKHRPKLTDSPGDAW